MTSRPVGQEGHCFLVEYYLSHVSPQDGKAESIASSLYEAIRITELEKNLQFIGSDGTVVMTRHSGVVIRILEERLRRPLQWSIRLLHSNEIPWLHVFRLLDGITILVLTVSQEKSER